MSPPDPHEEHHGSPLVVEPEDERLPIPKIVAVAIFSGVVFTLGILWAVQIMRDVQSTRARTTGMPAQATEVGKPEIGMVDQQLFTREERAAQLREEKLRELENYGWVSRKNGVIHIPIEEAMKAVARGKRPPGAGAPQPPPSPLPSAPVPIIVPPSPAAAPTSAPTGATGGAGPGAAPQKP